MRSRALWELAAVVVTGGLYLVFENVLHLKLAFMVPCILLWTCYLVWRLARRPGLRARWGLRLSRMKRALPACGVFFAASVGAILAYRLAAGWRPLPAEAVWVFLVYPVWSFVQQFVVQALVASNLKRLGAGPALIVPVAALLFGAAHLPDWPLVGICAGAGLAWSFLFLRYRSLYPLALVHAWLGALVYYWVLERNPWLEVFPPG